MIPKVSVIIPVYNVQEYLGQCLDTILLQSLQDIEVICVDDGSTDDSLGILNTYAFLDERVKVISQENAGPGAARNHGLKQAAGEFIMFWIQMIFFIQICWKKWLQRPKKINQMLWWLGIICMIIRLSRR